MEATQTLPNHLSTGLKMVQTPVMTREERRAALMRYLRARTPNKSTRKANEAKKMPESIKQQIEKDDRKKSYYFDMWLSCAEDWGRVVIYEKRIRRLTEESTMKEAWLNKAQLLDFFKCPVVVEALIAKKPAPEFQRPNPDIPYCPEATQYYVCVEESYVKTLAHESERGMVLSGNVSRDDRSVVEGLLQSTAQKPMLQDGADPRIEAAEEARRSAEQQKAKEEAEKKAAERKAAAEARAKERKEKLAQNPASRAQQWLNGIALHIRKCTDVQQEVFDFKADEDMKNLYHAKFKSHKEKLAALRGMFETGTPTNAQCVEAETELTAFKKSVKLWQSTSAVFKVKKQHAMVSHNARPGEVSVALCGDMSSVLLTA
jgi:hypothetical protein